MQRAIRWGIAGDNPDLHAMARALTGLPGAQLVAALGDDIELVADHYRVPRVYGTIEAFVRNPDVDAVYCASGLAARAWLIQEALAAGKSVLSGQPLGLGLLSTQKLIEAARRQGRFLCEAVYPLFLPVMGVVRHWLNASRIGRVVHMQATVAGERQATGPRGALSGSAAFGVHLAAMVFARPPLRVAALGEFDRTGTDAQATVALQYPGGGMATITALPRPYGSGMVTITGTKGSIRIEAFENANLAECRVDGGVPEHVAYPVMTMPETAMLEAVMDAIRRGEKEAPEVTLAQTLDVARVMDEARGMG